jgi:hypothetical protein
VKIDRLKTRVRLKSGGPAKDDRSKPAAPSLDFAQPKPMAAQPRIDEATDGPEEGNPAPQSADPRKVADRVYELMKNEMADARTRGGAGRRKR